jgi:hypothetical protein
MIHTPSTATGTATPQTSIGPDHWRIAAAPRELDSRASDGIQVRLLWYPYGGHVSVMVSDSKTGETFELEVREGDRPLDVFHHPYAYYAEIRDGDDLAAQPDSSLS